MALTANIIALFWIAYAITSLVTYLNISANGVSLAALILLTTAAFSSVIGATEALLAAKVFQTGRLQLDGFMKDCDKTKADDFHKNKACLKYPKLNIVFTALLDNEAATIIETILHNMTTIVYPPCRTKWTLVYNTKSNQKMETGLEVEMRRKLPGIELIFVPDSNTKAANHNYWLSKMSLNPCGVILLLDADHIVHPLGPLIACTKLSLDSAKSNLACILGRCIVRPSFPSTLLNRIAAGDQDFFSTVWQPGRAELFGQAIFTGSNGYWCAKKLRQLSFNTEAAIEDVDLSFQALSQGWDIVHDTSIISYELAPGSWRGYYNQRSRWAQGYLQLAHQFVSQFLAGELESSLPIGTYISLFSLTIGKEINAYLTNQYWLLLIALLFRAAANPTMIFATIKYYPVLVMLFALKAHLDFSVKKPIIVSQLASAYEFRDFFNDSYQGPTPPSRLTAICDRILGYIYPFITSSMSIMGHWYAIFGSSSWKANPTPRLAAPVTTTAQLDAGIAVQLNMKTRRPSIAPARKLSIVLRNRAESIALGHGPISPSYKPKLMSPRGVSKRVRRGFVGR